jgi:ribosomal protein S27E
MKFIDLTNQKFGKLTVLYRDPNSPRKYTKWICKCDCGNTTSVYSHALRQGKTKSCGCMSSKKNTSSRTNRSNLHGKSKSKLYHVYYSILDRCNNPNNKAYKHYGARGITICDEWEKSFENFYKWAISNGYQEGLTLERIDNNKGYSPENCKWIPKSEQVKNRRTTLYATINGETKTLKEWAEISGIKYSTLHYRKTKYNWPDERLLEQPTPYHRY